jgi:hypothetical protein
MTTQKGDSSRHRVLGCAPDAGAKEDRYEWAGKVLETWFWDNDASEQIAAAIREDLLQLTRPGDVFAGRYVDVEAFDTLAPHLNWRAVVGLDPGG